VLFLVRLCHDGDLSKAMRYAAQILRPVERIFAADDRRFGSRGRLAMVCLLALVFLRIVCSDRIGETPQPSYRRTDFGKIPGYTLLRGIIGDPENISGNHELKVALARIDDAWLFPSLSRSFRTEC